MARTTACVKGAFFGVSELLDAMLALLLANNLGVVHVLLQGFCDILVPIRARGREIAPVMYELFWKSVERVLGNRDMKSRTDVLHLMVGCVGPLWWFTALLPLTIHSLAK